MQTGEIFDIKKYAIHDGPGIRTTVFFKGCPLSCWWCHNPESLSMTTHRRYRPERCIGCQECLTACSNGAILEFEGQLQWTAADCRYCETCATVCPAEAVEFIGKTMTVDEVVAEITKDTLFYDQSGGGVTISGGEPLMQPTFLMQLLDACGELRLHRTLDTSGHAAPQTVLKVAARTGALASSLPGVIAINILPYHGAAEAKYRNFGLQNHAADVQRPSGDVIASIPRHLESYNLEVKIGG